MKLDPARIASRAPLIWLLALWLAFAGLPAWSEEVAVPPLQARVTDLTGTLDAAARHALETKLAALEQARGSQIAVLLVPGTRPESVEQYALRVAEAWKLGRAGVDDGVLLLVAKEERALRIEVGYGLEGAIPDAVAKRVIEEIIVPRFRVDDYAGGLEAGVTALIGLIEGEPLPEPRRRGGEVGGGDMLGDTLLVIMMFVFVAGNLLRALFGALIGALVAATVAFLGAWWLLGTVVSGVVVGAVVFVLTLLGVARFGGGGGAGGRSGSGGRGGGFSGGGGGFGGGGASGRW